MKTTSFFFNLRCLLLSHLPPKYPTTSDFVRLQWKSWKAKKYYTLHVSDISKNSKECKSYHKSIYTWIGFCRRPWGFCFCTMSPWSVKMKNSWLKSHVKALPLISFNCLGSQPFQWALLELNMFCSLKVVGHKRHWGQISVMLSLKIIFLGPYF